MPDQPNGPDRQPDERTRRRNKWILFGILVVTAVALYFGIMIRFYQGG